MENTNELEALFFLHEFISENKKAGKLPIEVANEIKQLWKDYQLPTVDENCAIISAEFGVLGSLVVRYITSIDSQNTLKYESGTYDYLSAKISNTKRILWTDYKNIEPYNRQCGLYCDGASFEHLGEPVILAPDYREFIGESNYTSNICFGVWGFDYNDYYNNVRFGICVKKELVDTFIKKLRILINK